MLSNKDSATKANEQDLRGQGNSLVNGGSTSEGGSYIGGKRLWDQSCSNKILKSTCKTIVPFITCLFNICIDKGVFPDCFKVAKVVPLFKGGDKEDPNCYTARYHYYLL